MILILLTLFLSHVRADDSTCSQVRTYQQFISCSVERHPALGVSKLKIQEGDALLGQSGQFENPDLEVKSVSGENGGEKVGSTELSLSIPISQLWKKGAERDVGRAAQRIAEIESKELVMKVQKEILKDTYRLRQVETELSLVTEAIGSFEKIEGQFRGRRARGPEQEITLNLVELAVGDYELKKNHLTTERAEILSRISALWGNSNVMKKDLLPPLKEKWPSIDSIPNQGTTFDVQKLVAESERASAEYRVANRNSWPELRAGPVAERNTEGPNQFWSYGVNASISLPLFSLNSGSRRLAETRAEQAKVLADYAQKKVVLDREILIQRYKSAIESLKRTSARKEINRKHDRVDSLFRQGLAAGGLVIEAHRQITEFTESQHEHEMMAIDSYIEIMAISGKGIEEILK